jgi:hypothetical protein
LASQRENHPVSRANRCNRLERDRLSGRLCHGRICRAGRRATSQAADIGNSNSNLSVISRGDMQGRACRSRSGARSLAHASFHC